MVAYALAAALVFAGFAAARVEARQVAQVLVQR